MTKDNKTYQKVISEVRSEFRIWRKNPYLTQKETRNLTILAIAPRFSKRVHRMLMAMRG